jgi:hypothetical protein
MIDMKTDKQMYETNTATTITNTKIEKRQRTRDKGQGTRDKGQGTKTKTKTKMGVKRHEETPIVIQNDMCDIRVKGEGGGGRERESGGHRGRGVGREEGLPSSGLSVLILTGTTLTERRESIDLLFSNGRKGGLLIYCSLTEGKVGSLLI